jgi:hypothetical protein
MYVTRQPDGNQFAERGAGGLATTTAPASSFGQSALARHWRRSVLAMSRGEASTAITAPPAARIQQRS